MPLASQNQSGSSLNSVDNSDNKKKRKASKYKKSKSVRPTLKDHTKTKVGDHDGFKQTETEVPVREVDNNVIQEDAVFTDDTEETDCHDIINLDFLKKVIDNSTKEIDPKPNIPDVEMNPLVISKPASREVITLDSAEQSYNKKQKKSFKIRNQEVQETASERCRSYFDQGR